jgi:hypothetical protein
VTWENIAAGFIGTLFAAGVALLVGILDRRSAARRAEVAAINVLLAELHYRRALVVPHPVSVQEPGADYERATHSVLSMRDLVKEARKMLRGGSKAFDPLGGMTAAMNEYLELADHNRLEYQFALVRLRDALRVQAAELAEVDRRIKHLAPGGRAFTN